VAGILVEHWTSGAVDNALIWPAVRRSCAGMCGLIGKLASGIGENLGLLGWPTLANDHAARLAVPRSCEAAQCALTRLAFNSSQSGRRWAAHRCSTATVPTNNRHSKGREGAGSSA